MMLAVLPSMPEAVMRRRQTGRMNSVVFPAEIPQLGKSVCHAGEGVDHSPGSGVMAPPNFSLKSPNPFEARLEGQFEGRQAGRQVRQSWRPGPRLMPQSFPECHRTAVPLSARRSGQHRSGSETRHCQIGPCRPGWPTIPNRRYLAQAAWMLRPGPWNSRSPGQARSDRPQLKRGQLGLSADSSAHDRTRVTPVAYRSCQILELPGFCSSVAPTPFGWRFRVGLPLFPDRMPP